MNYVIPFVVGFIALQVISFVIPEMYSNMMLGSKQVSPFTMQFYMWLIFFVGIGDVLEKISETKEMKKANNDSLLPDGDEILYTASELIPLYKKCKNRVGKKYDYITSMSYEVVLQFRANSMVGSAHEVLNSLLQIFEEKILNQFSRLKYIVWLIPTLGFMGTVFGISRTVGVVGKSEITDPNLLSMMTTELAFAFDTTMLALVQSAVLMWFINQQEAKQISHLYTAGQVVLKDLVNKLVEKKSGVR